MHNVRAGADEQPGAQPEQTPGPPRNAAVGVTRNTGEENGLIPEGKDSNLCHRLSHPCPFSYLKGPVKERSETQLDSQF